MSSDYDLNGQEIAVIGMAGRFPGAPNLDRFWDNLKNSVESITFYPEAELLEAGIDEEMLKNPRYIKSRGGMLEDKEYFDAGFFGYSAVEAELMDPQSRVFHECAWQALEDAGYDSFAFPGLIGLYAGASFNFNWELLSWFSDKRRVLGDFSTYLLIDADTMCTRISYNLNLKGPGIVVKTACSTSLAAVHLAFQALLNGECDMALAGGVSIIRLSASGYIYQEEMIFSPDGHCRAFDARSRGTIGGDGAGIVVLKRLAEALADRDHIYALVKGTAINNDGIRRAGYTAPGVVGQAEVIAEALRVAEVPAETITYVETHGTGTAVGDPIEIESLKLAFNTDKKQFCPIGTVKTNIGHLDSAAGIAGFIKTVLALKYRCIPPSLHFETPNPAIDFQNSPFYVNTRLSVWESHGFPLRAGVSSFGIGGTNAHVILEEWRLAQSAERKVQNSVSQVRGVPGGATVNVSPPLQSREYQLILLSAKTPTALDKMIENLAGCFKKNLLNRGNHENPTNPVLTLADAAYTLLPGRRAFAYRCMLVCADVEEAVRTLSSAGSRKPVFAHVKDKKKSIIFMFPGLGAQYVSMGRELYRKEPLFREEMDHCFEILKPLMGNDIKEILYPEEIYNRSNRSYRSYIPNINQFEMSQLVVFMVEYALARLLMKWGIKPDVMIGYSFGEYTAACLSGVFSLEDALKLLLVRGQLIAGVPAGAMLSVPLPAKELKPFLTSDLCIAIDNGASCIAAGPGDQVEALASQLKAQRCLSMPLAHSHALHSSMMDPILGEFAAQVARVKLHEPQIPYISNVTGKRQSSREAADPGYWCRHLRETVQFAAGIEELKKETSPIFIEIGPGHDLCTLLVRHETSEVQLDAVNLMPAQQQKIPDHYYLAKKIGQLWLKGVGIDGQAYYHGQERHRISLPVYPFEKQRFWWLDPVPKRIDDLLLKPGIPPKKTDPGDWFYIPQWKRTVFPGVGESETGTAEKSKNWLLFINGTGPGTRLARYLETHDRVIVVRPGQGFEAVTDKEYIINPGSEVDYDRLFAHLREIRYFPGNILHLWCAEEGSGLVRDGWFELDRLDFCLDLGLYSLLNIARAIDVNGIGADICLGVITTNMQPVTGEEELCPEKAAMLGPIKIIPQEYPHIKCLGIDIMPMDTDTQKQDSFIYNLLREFSVPVLGCRLAAYRGAYRWIETYEPLRTDYCSPADKNRGWKRNGVYLITGGLGGMGFSIAGHLAQEFQARLILVDLVDFPLSLKPGQDSWLAGEERQKDIQQKKQTLLQWEQLGAQIQIHHADVCDLQQMQAVISKAEEGFGKIDGVIHTAGLIDYSGVICRRTREMTESVLESKIKGTLVLDEVLKHQKLDFMILFSSGGNIFYQFKFGQVGYNAGHEFLDVFCQYKQKQGERVITIDWNDWSRVGMAARAHKQENSPGLRIPGIERADDILSISPDQGIDVLQRIVSNDFCRVVVFTRDLEQMLNYINKITVGQGTISSMPGWQQQAPRPGSGTSLYERPELENAYVPPENEIQENLVNIWQEFFGISRVGIDDDFFELGGDSLKSSVIIARIHKKLEVLITMAEFFQEPTIRGLALIIATNKGKHIHFPVEPLEKQEYYELSSAQRRLYILQQMSPGGLGYNTPCLLILEGSVDKNRLEETIRDLVNRHESFRTSFHMLADRPVQKIYETNEPGYKIESYIDKTQTAGTGNRESSSILWRFIRPFDLSHAPLLRIGLAEAGKAKQLLLADMHHIISDGTSIGIFIREFTVLYAGEKLPPLAIQYKDFTYWQNSPYVRKLTAVQEKYWLGEFAGEIPVLELPTDFPRPLIQSFAGSIIRFEIDKKETHALKTFALEAGTTLFMVLLAIYNVFLFKITGQEDIVVGTPIAGRHHTDLQQVIGVLINTLALRNLIEEEKNFHYLLGKIKTNTLQAYSHQDYPYEELVEKVVISRDTRRNPLFDTMFMMHNFETPVLEIPGLKIKPGNYDPKTSRFDLTLVICEEKETLRCIFEFSTKLFKTGTIERFTGYFREIVGAVPGNPGKKIAEVEILPAEEKKQVLYGFNDTAVEYPADRTIWQLFANRAIKTAHRTAVIEPGPGAGRGRSLHLTYQELHRQSRGMGKQLKEKGARPGTIVGIIVNRCCEMLTGLLAVLESGAAYLPIDPGNPIERTRQVLEHAGVDILLTDRQESPGRSCTTIIDPTRIDPGCIDSGGNNPGSRVLPQPNTRDVPGPRCCCTSTDLAYVIYTSGTTGTPKGVMIEHGNVVNFIKGITDIIPFEAGDRVLSLTTIGFDIFVLEALVPLSSGSTVAIGNREEQLNAGAAASVLEQEAVTIFQLTPSRLQLLVSQETIAACLGRVKYLLVGGEALPPGLLDTARTYTGGKIYNLYGPTETTVWSTIKEVTGNKTLNIGKPIANTMVYILSKNRRVQPVGVSGEIYIGGAGVARGYLKDDALTREKFLENPFICESFNREIQVEGLSGRDIPAKMYRTGDLGKWLPGGNIQFLGRIDHQVKIRGYRIELEEIENCLADHPRIKEAAAAVKTGKSSESSDKQLCAYVVAADPGAAHEPGFLQEIKDHLARLLPAYMIPSLVMVMDQIPLSPNGKIARKALPEPVITADPGYTPPANEIQLKLVRIWAGVLGVEEKVIGIDSDFFRLNGHSLKAAVMAGRVHKEFNVTFSLAEFFNFPTVGGLAEKIKQITGTGSGYVSIQPVEKKEYYPLSSIQKRLYVLKEIEPGSIAYNLPSISWLEGRPDKSRMEEVLNALVKRHESLRTSFGMAAGKPVQKIHPNEITRSNTKKLAAQRPNKSFDQTFSKVWPPAGPPEADQIIPLQLFTIEYYEARDRELGSSEGIIREFIRPFDLTQAPLLRVGLVKITEREYILLADMHHIVSDGTSTGIFIDEFLALYAGESLPLPRIQYKDFSVWQDSEGVRECTARQEAFWIKEFSGPVPVLELPGDFPRPAVQSSAGSAITFRIDKQITAALGKYALEQGTTLFMVMLTVYNIFLARISGQEDIVVGTPTAGRRHTDLEGIIGVFLNTMALRNFPAGNKSLKEFTAEIKEKTLNAFENQDYPFENLVEKLGVERDTSRNPLFDVMLIFQNFATSSVTAPGQETPGFNIKPYDYERNSSINDMTLYIREIDEELHCIWEYCRKLFKESTIKRWISYFQRVISGVLSAPQLNISGIELISAAEKQWLLLEINNTRQEISRDKCFYRIFEEMAIKNPHRAALRYNRAVITYEELNRQVHGISCFLQEQGLGPDRVVGVYMERGPGLLASILGVFKAGSAYLPIETNYPRPRVQYMLENSETPVVITNGKNRAIIGSLQGTLPHLTAVLCLEPGGTCPREYISMKNSGDNPGSPGSADSLAYLIYTSGTTGTPKGAMIEQIGMLNHIAAKIRYFSLTGSDVVAQTGPACFDISVWQLLTPLKVGSYTFIVDEKDFFHPWKFLGILQEETVTLLEFVPTWLTGFLEVIEHEKKRDLPYMRWMISTGDTLPVTLVKKWYEMYPGIKIANAYGPTEASDDIAHYTVEPGPLPQGETIPVGRPLDNLHIYIMDRYMKLCPVGIRGEICVSGIGVGRGYWKDPAKTAASFIDNPYSEAITDKDHARLYKVGDTGYIREDGIIECLGRQDHQVKIRGHRLELGEIESHLLASGIVKETVITVNRNTKGEKYLCAYVVFTRTGCTIEELKEYLTGKLPHYMVPSFFAPIDSIPLTANGKPDRKVLPEPGEKAGPGDIDRAPASLVEIKLAEIWAQVLEIEKNALSINSDFFQLGGHSLKAIEVISKIRERLGVDLPLNEFFTRTSIKQQAGYLGAHKEPGKDLGKEPGNRIYNRSFRRPGPYPYYYNCYLACIIEKIKYENHVVIDRDLSMLTGFLPGYMNNKQSVFEFFFLYPYARLAGLKTLQSRLRIFTPIISFATWEEIMEYCKTQLSQDRLVFLGCLTYFLHYTRDYLQESFLERMLKNARQSMHMFLLIDICKDGYMIYDPNFDYYGLISCSDFHASIRGLKAVESLQGSPLVKDAPSYQVIKVNTRFMKSMGNKKFGRAVLRDHIKKITSHKTITHIMNNSKYKVHIGQGALQELIRELKRTTPSGMNSFPMGSKVRSFFSRYFEEIFLNVVMLKAGLRSYSQNHCPPGLEAVIADQEELQHRVTRIRDEIEDNPDQVFRKDRLISELDFIYRYQETCYRTLKQVLIV